MIWLLSVAFALTSKDKQHMRIADHVIVYPNGMLEAGNDEDPSSCYNAKCDAAANDGKHCLKQLDCTSENHTQCDATDGKWCYVGANDADATTNDLFTNHSGSLTPADPGEGNFSGRAESHSDTIDNSGWDDNTFNDDFKGHMHHWESDLKADVQAEVDAINARKLAWTVWTDGNNGWYWPNTVLVNAWDAMSSAWAEFLTALNEGTLTAMKADLALTSSTTARAALKTARAGVLAKVSAMYTKQSELLSPASRASGPYNVEVLSATHESAAQALLSLSPGEADTQMATAWKNRAFENVQKSCAAWKNGTAEVMKKEGLRVGELIKKGEELERSINASLAAHETEEKRTIADLQKELSDFIPQLQAEIDWLTADMTAKEEEYKTNNKTLWENQATQLRELKSEFQEKQLNVTTTYGNLRDAEEQRHNSAVGSLSATIGELTSKKTDAVAALATLNLNNDALLQESLLQTGGRADYAHQQDIVDNLIAEVKQAYDALKGAHDAIKSHLAELKKRQGELQSHQAQQDEEIDETCRAMTATSGEAFTSLLTGLTTMTTMSGTASAAITALKSKLEHTVGQDADAYWTALEQSVSDATTTIKGYIGAWDTNVDAFEATIDSEDGDTFKRALFDQDGSYHTVAQFGL